MMIESKAMAPKIKTMAVIFFMITALVFFDIVADAKEGGFSIHILLELLIGLISASAFTWLALTLKNTRESLLSSQQSLQISKVESEKWKKEAMLLIKGLSQSIDTQFENWKFTKAEKDIALLLLKGLTLKDIALVRETSEKTVRAQSLSIYAKSNLAGRNELSAFFLEDLLAPV